MRGTRILLTGAIMDIEKWTTHKILIIGSTYPALSQKYTELSCTGGMLEDGLKLARLHPIPRRYLDENQRFHAFQWIEAKIMKDPSDPRPESYKIDFKTIKLGDIVGNHEDRRRYIEKSPYLFKSLEQLKKMQKEQATSMGIIQPEAIIDCKIQMRSKSEREEWDKNTDYMLSQKRLFDENPKPIAFPEARFRIEWKCNDDNCPTHAMSLEQWGIQELYRKYPDKEEAKQKVLDSMNKRLDQNQYDLFFFIGSFRDKQYNFGLMDTYGAPKKRQSRLF
jgi:hypothetical protein